MTSKEKSYTYEDEKAWRQVSFSWATAYNTKDWPLLDSIAAPQVQMLVSEVDSRGSNKTVPKAEYIARFSSKAMLGDERIASQHLLGAANFEVKGPTSAIGHWQIQVGLYRKLADGNLREWTVASYVDHMYERIDGIWKLAGFRPHTKLWERGEMYDVLGEFD
ncbi:Scytalone dehydratase [Elsinoe ampelina]|uniref:Scytalone dehydratase n=1 Tax=Elsinoe ampelina TaxID=302913 RepID=A0A6A6GCK0_9PEZI|nr:Scytalone dehydratase [Elsinoe ampelina]